jgi:Sugar (and other) transporter
MGARSRLLVIVPYSIFQQWNGGGIIGQYLVPALETVGIDKPFHQLSIDFGSNTTYLVFTVCGSFIVDRFNRRTLIFAGLISLIILQTAATIASLRCTPPKLTRGLQSCGSSSSNSAHPSSSPRYTTSIQSKCSPWH